MQQIRTCDVTSGVLSGIISDNGWQRLLLVCDDGFSHLTFARAIRGLPQIAEAFSRFSSNPSYESVCEGVRAFRGAHCDAILAVGGGSAIDVAKCIKLFSGMSGDRSYLEQPQTDSGVPLVAVPTTAGTGSESTRYAVIYADGQKQSITHDSILPDYALLDASALITLPPYQKKCTMLDAMCQAIESFWSVNSTDDSRALSEEALRALTAQYQAYLAGDGDAAKAVMRAANLAGQAINITQTTAAHAMSYQLTKLFGLPHGHAAAVCLPGVWRAILRRAADTTDPRGEAYLNGILERIARAMGCADAEQAVMRFERILDELDVRPPKPTPEQLDALSESVNPTRLRNSPIAFTKEMLYALYADREAAI